MIYITGDTHGLEDIDRIFTQRFKEGYNLCKDDYLIIAGDFGCLYGGGISDKTLLRRIEKECKFTTLFIDGNHENFDLLERYPVEYWNGGKVHRINDSVIHLMRGQVFTLNGYKFFTFGGAHSIDKHRRKEGKSWWKQEVPSTSEYEEAWNNLHNADYKVDFIVTHTCSENVFNRVGPTNKLPSEIEYNLKQIEDKVEFSHWYFGHYHEDTKVHEKHTALYDNILKLV